MKDYLSTVAVSGQVNTPPGSYVTVKEWAQHSFMTPESRVLEVGCSNGFISVELARYTGARCIGIDLHASSVDAARRNIDLHVSERVEFRQADAGKLPFNADTFSHVVIGGHLPFVHASRRRGHIKEAVRTLRPWGYLLVALYYYRIPPPDKLVREFNRKIGTKLSTEGDKTHWAGLFEGFPIALEYDAEYEVLPADEERTRQYVLQMSSATRRSWRDYLRLFNENGSYLEYFVRVYRKVPDGPNVMRQIPRGGIYRVRKKRETSY